MPLQAINTVLVIGAGNGGRATAADLALQVTSDLAEALSGDPVDAIFVCSVAHAHAALARELSGHALQPTQVVVLNPGSTGGTLVFAEVWREQCGMTELPILVEFGTLAYGCRAKGCHVSVKVKLNYLEYSCLPSCKLDAVAPALEALFPGLVRFPSVLAVALSNTNPCIHPSITLLNLGRIQQQGSGMLFYREGASPMVARLIQALDEERLALLAALGYTGQWALPDPAASLLQGYTERTGSNADELYYQCYQGTVYSQFSAPDGSVTHEFVRHRYFQEDVGCGLGLWTSLGRLLGVPTPASEAARTLASVVVGQDLSDPHRFPSVATLGLQGLTAEAILVYLETGSKHSNTPLADPPSQPPPSPRLSLQLSDHLVPCPQQHGPPQTPHVATATLQASLTRGSLTAHALARSSREVLSALKHSSQEFSKSMLRQLQEHAEAEEPLDVGGSHGGGGSSCVARAKLSSVLWPAQQQQQQQQQEVCDQPIHSTAPQLQAAPSELGPRDGNLQEERQRGGGQLELSRGSSGPRDGRGAAGLQQQLPPGPRADRVGPVRPPATAPHARWASPTSRDWSCPAGELRELSRSARGITGGRRSGGPPAMVSANTVRSWSSGPDQDRLRAVVAAGTAAASRGPGGAPPNDEAELHWAASRLTRSAKQEEGQHQQALLSCDLTRLSRSSASSSASSQGSQVRLLRSSRNRGSPR